MPRPIAISPPRRTFDGTRKSYAAHHNEPFVDGTSGLSPYLHFGHVSAHEIFAGVADAEEWSPVQMGERAMSSERTRVKVSVDAYLERFASDDDV